MDRWKGKVAVVTGASSGIGAVVCKELVRAGMVVIGLARRVNKIEVIIIIHLHTRIYHPFPRADTIFYNYCRN